MAGFDVAAEDHAIGGGADHVVIQAALGGVGQGAGGAGFAFGAVERRARGDVAGDQGAGAGQVLAREGGAGFGFDGAGLGFAVFELCEGLAFGDAGAFLDEDAHDAGADGGADAGGLDGFHAAGGVDGLDGGAARGHGDGDGGGDEAPGGEGGGTCDEEGCEDEAFAHGGACLP